MCRCFYACVFWCFSVFQKQLFGMESPSPVQLTGWRKHFNSYTLQGRRNVRNATKRNTNTKTNTQ
uniref:Secreted protein n=1 Tax=Cyprinodon variegatus TaxID=28743 RepID=A0A3Q2EAM8_CYPVA